MTEQWRTHADEALARGRRLDRRIPAFLLRSPVSRAGYYWATLVGWVWGALWSTGPVEYRQGLWVFRGMPSWTFRRGGVCVGACFLTGEAEPSEAVLRHERVHKQQWLRYGMLMPVLYFASGVNALTNRMEIEAGLEDGGYVARAKTGRKRSGI